MITITIFVCLTIVITSFIWMIILKNQKHVLISDNQKLSIDLQNVSANVEFQVAQKLSERLDSLNEQIFTLKQQNIEVERESYNKGKTDTLSSFANEYYVQVYPYKHNYKDEQGFYVFNKRKEFIEVGYQYQLFVKGIPVFKPHVVALETHEKNHFQLNEEAIKDMVKLMVAGSAPGAGSFMKIADTVKTAK
ncbi:hypothetical protein [Flavobacterium sp.]|uniref:hypothetical protein n=1 Tax=Flavobacterium sp. TaxID=239 RepID=UPI0025C3B31F|nr:hypothetical protein [Flavobacterium sp.]